MNKQSNQQLEEELSLFDFVEEENDNEALMQSYIDKLNQASQAYYNGLSEMMTDYEWDALFDKLKKLEEETGIVLSDSPTNNVSSDSISGQKEEHEFSALSLAKTKKVEDLVKWAESRKIWMSWKLDGLTLVVTYDNGSLSKVVTRGDGHIGTNITHLASGISGIPTKIKDKGHLVVRGEAIISYSDFEKFNLESEEEYANPRNLAAGSLSLKDIDELKRRKITWIAFTLVSSQKQFTSWGSQMDYLEQQGFSTVEHYSIDKPDSSSIGQMIDSFSEKVVKNINPYPVDGLVICYDDVNYSSTGSVTGHHATRAGYAFKWADEAADTVLNHIEWSCAVGSICPVAIFKPVSLEGTTVKRASLVNISECERLGIGQEGTEISVIKANKIIPKVIKVNKKIGELTIPERCPVCNYPTFIDESIDSGTKLLKCSNPNCDAKQLRKYERFVSKPATNIEGISTSTLATFISQGWIKNYGDIYRLVDHYQEITNLDNFGKKSADNIVASINKAKVISDVRLIYSLNIPTVGLEIGKRLLSMGDFDTLVSKSIAVNNKELTIEEAFPVLAEGIGYERLSAFVEWFTNDNVDNLHDLLQLIEIEKTESEPSGNKCEGLTFVVTGEVTTYKNRNELKEYIESQGGKVVGSVSKSTNYLINNDIESTSGKNQKAKALNIPIISEANFNARFKD